MSDRRQPTPEERDERVSIPLPPDVALAALMETGPHQDDADADADAERDRKSEGQ